MNININSTHHHAVSHLVFVVLFSPLQPPLLLSFFFFWEFGDCWSRLPRTSKWYYQCAAAALVGHVNFCCCSPPLPPSLPPPLCHSFSCSLTCHKPQVKKSKKHFRILFVFHFVTIKQIINVKKQFMASAKLLPKLKPLATATATAIATFIDPL